MGSNEAGDVPARRLALGQTRRLGEEVLPLEVWSPAMQRMPRAVNVTAQPEVRVAVAVASAVGLGTAPAHEVHGCLLIGVVANVGELMHGVTTVLMRLGRQRHFEMARPACPERREPAQRTGCFFVEHVSEVAPD